MELSSTRMLAFVRSVGSPRSALVKCSAVPHSLRLTSHGRWRSSYWVPRNWLRREVFAAGARGVDHLLAPRDAPTVVCLAASKAVLKLRFAYIRSSAAAL